MRLQVIRVLGGIAVLLVLAGCQVLPGALRDGAQTAPTTQSPVTGGDIEVTSLDTPVPEGTEAESMAVPLSPVPDTLPDASTEAAPGTAADAALAEDAPADPVVIKTAAQLDCEARGRIWSVMAGGAAAFCQTPTRDSGKSCRASTDCSGYCLAQSGTCAPVTPMLGCHDILNEAGRMLTQCIN